MSLSIGNIANSLQSLNMPQASENAAADQGAGAGFTSALGQVKAEEKSKADESCGGHRSHRRHHRTDDDSKCGKAKPKDKAEDCGDKGDSKSEMRELLDLVKQLVTTIGKMLEAKSTSAEPPAGAGAGNPTMDTQMPADPAGGGMPNPAEQTNIPGMDANPAADPTMGQPGSGQPAIDPSMLNGMNGQNQSITPIFGAQPPAAPAPGAAGGNNAQLQQVLASLQGTVGQLSSLLAANSNGSTTGA